MYGVPPMRSDRFHSDTESERESDSESDTDSVEEVHITKFLQKGLLGNIQQAKACAAVKTGIKKHLGHYHLRDRAHAVIEPKAVAYTGKHWDVSLPHNFQRATRRLTAYTIARAVHKEQLRRVHSQVEDRRAVLRMMHPINTEYWDRIEKGFEVQRELEAKKHRELATTKDDALCELTRKFKKKILDEELEEERERQVAMVSILNGVKDSVHKSPSLEKIMSGIAEVNHQKGIVQQDLVEAFARFEDEEEEVDTEYRGAMMEMMDESLNCLKLMFHRAMVKKLEEEEQKRRIKESRERLQDKNFLKTRRHFDGVLEDMQAAFNKVESAEISELADKEQEVSDRKEMVLQQLRRMYAKGWVEKMAARERKRRLKEAERNLYYDDPRREAMLKLMARVQRQMILQKFAGIWINKTEISKKKNEIIEQGEVESDHDKKLRAIRLKARRQSCVKSGMS